MFKDPGGYGIVRYKKIKKFFFDLSENTSLPYEIIIKSQNYECKIDELNNNISFLERDQINFVINQIIFTCINQIDLI